MLVRLNFLLESARKVIQEVLASHLSNLKAEKLILIALRVLSLMFHLFT